MEKKIYVIGHKNPDTDSVVSAAAYAYYKNEKGVKNCYAARAGKINQQTEYIFNRFKVDIPEFLPDLIPRAKYYCHDEIATVDSSMPLWDAVSKMENDGKKVLPIVDDNENYLSLLHYNAFARYILNKVNPRQKAIIQTTVNHLVNTLHGNLSVSSLKDDEVVKSFIYVAGSEFNSFKQMVESQLPETLLVIVGDREDIQKYCIEKKVRAIIITHGNLMKAALQEEAKKNGVAVITSPFDTSATSLLIIYSTPVYLVGDKQVSPVLEDSTLNRVKAEILKSPDRVVPIVNYSGKITGILSEADLIKEPNIQVIMVDHNETSQAIDGIENFSVLEVIDHHRLGNLSTKNPITFINKPVGATSTIIASLFIENKIPIKKEIASILLCGILSDTLVLQSSTTTITDKEIAEYLSGVTGLDILALGKDLMTVTALIAKKSPLEIINQDMKVYKEFESKFSVSQIEVNDTQHILTREKEVLEVLEEHRKKENFIFSALMVTDITALDSVLFVAAEKDFYSLLTFPKISNNIYSIKSIVSRKKQLLPLLSELIEKLN